MSMRDILFRGKLSNDQYGKKSKLEMTHASLFSGIGGFDLAASKLGWTNAFNCEIDPFCRRVLDYHFQDAKGYEDIKTTDFREWRGKVDVLSGGFPCQPFSTAGLRRGKDDDRYLWPHMLRVIREIQPTWVIGENVAGITSMVQPSEEVEVGNSTHLFSENYITREEQRFTLEEILQSLERERYEVQAFIIPACGVGAPHRRDRVWIVAYSNSTRSRDTMRTEQKRTESIREQLKRFKSWSQSFDGLASNSNFQERRRQCEFRQREGEFIGRSIKDAQAQWRKFPAKPPVCGGDDGLSRELDTITFPCWRRESIKAYGNSIVPQIAMVLFSVINQLSNNYQM